MNYLCACSCGEEHNFASYHLHIQNDEVLWFSSKVHRDRWKAKQFGVDVTPKVAQLPLGYYN